MAMRLFSDLEKATSSFDGKRRFVWCVVPTAREKRIAPLRKRDGSKLYFSLRSDQIDQQPTDILPLVVYSIHPRLRGVLKGRVPIIGTNASGRQRISRPTDGQPIS